MMIRQRDSLLCVTTIWNQLCAHVPFPRGHYAGGLLSSEGKGGGALTPLTRFGCSFGRQGGRGYTTLKGGKEALLRSCRGMAGVPCVRSGKLGRRMKISVFS